MSGKEIEKKHYQTFESIRQENDKGFEFWYARDLQPILDYSSWEKFKQVINKAVTACKKSGQAAENHFSRTVKMVPIGSGAKREIEDYKLSRYACYLIVQNGDPTKPVIANGQSYFAIQTRRQELADNDAFQRLKEDEKRLFLRNELKEHNKQLVEAAQQAGVENNIDFAIFQNHGYNGLYGGLDAQGIHKRKGLKKSQKILDHMGSTELAANLFRATQTEEKLRRENIKGKTKANETHYQVGAKVRQTIKELGGTMPEELPRIRKKRQTAGAGAEKAGGRGMIPSGWKIGRVKDFIKSLDSGVSVNGEDRPPNDNEPAVLKVSAVTYGVFDPTASKPILKGELKRARCNPKAGQIIISRSNTPALVGASAYIDDDYPNRYLPDKLWLTVPSKDADVCLKWLAYFLASPWVRFRLSSLATGTSNSMKNITKDELLCLPIPIPPVTEQTAIADLLSIWDKAIEKTEQLIAAKEKWLDWYRQQLFLSNTIKSSSWERLHLAEILKEHGKLSTGAEEVFSVSVHKGVVNQIDHLGRTFAAKDKSKYNLVHPGDIIYTKSPTGNYPYGIIKQSVVDKNVIVSPLYGVFTPLTVEIGTIIDFYFESPVNTNNYLRPKIQKGAKNTMSITNKAFLSGSLILPTSKEEQKRITSIINIARQEIELLKKQAEAYRKQKRGLMQKFLTGTWRVKIEDNHYGCPNTKLYENEGLEEGAL